jgi:hypothetical protein
MIELYTWPTPNGHKIHIMLEETGLAYRVIPIDIGKGDQFDPAFLKISPNNRMPAIVDPDGPDGAPISLFESGAILIYLADKTGQFLPTEARARYTVLQWLMFQMGGVGPMLGQAHHFRFYAPEKIPYAVDRYTNEAALAWRPGLHDRRHGDVSLAARPRAPGPGSGGFPERCALVRNDRRASRGAARAAGSRRAPDHRATDRRSPGKPFWRKAVRPKLTNP